MQWVFIFVFLTFAMFHWLHPIAFSWVSLLYLSLFDKSHHFLLVPFNRLILVCPLSLARPYSIICALPHPMKRLRRFGLDFVGSVCGAALSQIFLLPHIVFAKPDCHISFWPPRQTLMISLSEADRTCSASNLKHD